MPREWAEPVNAPAAWFLARAAAYARLMGSRQMHSAWVRRDPCVYCLAAANTIDHIVPIARGGGSGHDNLVAACRTCNFGKADTPVLVFLIQQWGRPQRLADIAAGKRKGLRATIADLLAGRKRRILGDRT